MNVHPAGPGELPVNHHAAYPGCSGITGILGGLAMLLLGRSTARLVVDLAELSSGDRAIDLGCGPGNAVRLAARVGAQATGIDPSTAMLRIARAVTRAASPQVRDRVDWIAAGVEDCPLPDASASAVWTVRSVHHWTDVDAGLAQARRLLRPAGRLIAVERLVRPGARGLASHGWTTRQAETFAALCRDAGFADVRVDERRIGRQSAAVVRAVKPSLGRPAG